MATWFRTLGPVGKGLAVIATAALLGAAAAGLVGLPAQVEENTENIAVNTDSIGGLGTMMGRMICLQLLPEEGNPLSCP